ncbi:hypothetical protein HYS92_00150 [Candidatus Daviesbacteria bacterium]|nr:hypothetical protein [Candidatus Daviesbacteria bacterium]
MKAKVKYLLLIIGLIITVLVVKKLYLVLSVQNPPNISFESPKAVQLELKYPYEVKDLTDKEKGGVLQLVRTFETLQYERKAKEVLALFTLAALKDEKDQLDFLEGKDINSSPRLYSTAEFNCSLNWYMVRSIEKDNAGISVTLKELRTYYNNETADYIAKIDDFTLALSLKKDNGYQVEGYKQESPGKYSGFDCL